MGPWADFLCLPLLDCLGTETSSVGPGDLLLGLRQSHELLRAGSLNLHSKRTMHDLESCCLIYTFFAFFKRLVRHVSLLDAIYRYVTHRIR